jgi:hypothetical protein
MDLYLRKSDHGLLDPEGYRVILKDDGDEVEIGSISVQHSASASYYWSWAIDTVIPMRSMETSGRGKDRPDRMRQFKSAWERFAADEANLTTFLAEKRRARQRDRGSRTAPLPTRAHTSLSLSWPDLRGLIFMA